MKSRDLFCTSHASTAICSSMDQRRIVRPISRRTPATTPCSDQLPFHPTYSYIIRKTSSSSPKHSSSPPFLNNQILLSDSKNNTQALVPYQPLETKPRHISGDTPAAVIPSSSSSPPPPPKPPVVYNPSSLTRELNVKSSSSSNHQVVELRVAIHCKGCEGKVRKHLSKMEGVTSFSIDLDSKKVTVIGNVTPLGVLANISKVKNAQIWPSSATLSPSVSLPIR